MNRRSLLIGGGILTGLILVVWGVVWLTGLSGQMKLNAEAAESIVLEQYPGEIVETTAQHDRYSMQLESEKGRYQLEIDGNSGAIVSIVRLEQKNGANLSPDGAGGDQGPNEGNAEHPDSTNGGDPGGRPGDDPGSTGGSSSGSGGSGNSGAPSSDGGSPDRGPEGDPNPDIPEPNKPVYIGEKEAARIALEQVPGEVDDVDFYRRNNQVYYLVEIEVDDEREEAVIQVHALTGEVLSITWDEMDDE